MIYAYLTDKNTLVLTSTEKYEVGDEFDMSENITKYYGSTTGVSKWGADVGTITKVVIEDKIEPVTMASWFLNCTNLESIEGMEKLDTSKLTSMYATFNGCNNIQELDVSEFNTSNVTNMSNMFYGCKNLGKIYISNKFTTDAVTNSSSMFGGCTKLVGGAGTTYNSNNIDKTYARIDGGPESSTPGYFTLKPTA